MTVEFSHQQTGKDWGTLNDFDEFKPPSILTHKQMSKCRQWINGLNGKALVLGLTLSMRQLAHDNDFEVYCVDIDKDVALNTYNLVDKKKYEHILISNWLSVPLSYSTFDIILGDASFNQLKYPQEYEQLIKRVYNWLSPEGLFLYRFYRPEMFDSAEQVFAKHENLKNATFDGLYYDFAGAVADKMNWVFDTSKIGEVMNANWDRIKDLAEKGIIDKKDLSKKRWLAQKRIASIRTKQEVIALFSKYFEVIGEFDENYHYANGIIMLMRPRK
ncbi:class I SAM-dependent methyltransferase [Thermoproteota archaeon]